VATTTSILEQYIADHPKSRALHERARKVLPGGIAHDVRHISPFPLTMDRAEGAYKWDVDGHKYIDYVVGHGALILGHSHPAIVGAVQEQVAKGTHLGAGNPFEIEWAELVQRLVPSAELVKFTSSGTEATMMALRLARAYTGKSKILKFAGHFHGWHDYAVAGQAPPWDVPVSPGVPAETLSTVIIAPVNDLDFVERRLAEGDIAGVIMETTGASWGTIPFPSGFHQRLREITRKQGVVLIFDEVITGFRYAPGGAQATIGVTPDLTTMAKILAGGLPGGAVAGSAEIMNLLTFRDDPEWNRRKKVSHPGTYNANPLSAVAGVTALNILSDPAQQEYAANLAARLRSGFNRVLVHEEVPGFCYGESSLFHLVLGTPLPGGTPDGDLTMPQGIAPETLKAGIPHKLNDPLYAGMMAEGVEVFHGGGLLSIAHTEADVDRTIEAFDTTIRRMIGEGVFE
jgi:glutamate-1-semialdehyde 2,1-aminomutase